jgi:hypothetical protein
MEYSFMILVSQPISFEKIKEIVHGYSLGELHSVHCVAHPNGIRQVTFHYSDFTHEYFRYILDEYARTKKDVPCMQYATVNGKPKSWFAYKTLTPQERTKVHFRPIQRIS